MVSGYVTSQLHQEISPDANVSQFRTSIKHLRSWKGSGSSDAPFLEVGSRPWRKFRRISFFPDVKLAGVNISNLSRFIYQDSACGGEGRQLTEALSNNRRGILRPRLSSAVYSPPSLYDADLLTTSPSRHHHHHHHTYLALLFL